MEERGPPDEPLDDAAIDQIMAEFRRIGFGMEELGGLAVIDPEGNKVELWQPPAGR